VLACQISGLYEGMGGLADRSGGPENSVTLAIHSESLIVLSRWRSAGKDCKLISSERNCGSLNQGLGTKSKVTIKIIIVDDHPVVRFGLRQMLSSDPQVEVVGELSGIDKLPDLLAKAKADIILLDLELDDAHGVEALKVVREAVTDIRVIIYTSHSDEARIIEAAELGVDGYLLKGCGQRELLGAIHNVQDGGTALESSVAHKLMQHMNKRSTIRRQSESVRFSKREYQVLKLLASGKTNRDIGETLFISESTVKFHVHMILNKLEAGNRTEAVSIAAKLGVVELQ